MSELHQALLPARVDVLEVPTRYGGNCLIPLNGARVRLSGSALYPGYRWTARLFRAVLRTWVTLGGARLTHRVHRRRGGDWPLGQLLGDELPSLSTAAAAVSADGHRKIALQLMDARGRVLAFAKYADSPDACARLANEARMLQAVPTGVAPRFLRFVEFRQGVVLVQSAVPGRPYAPRTRLDRAQVQLLERLVQPGPAFPANEHPFVRRLCAEAPRYRPLIESLVRDLGDAEWPLVFMHGDFWFGNVYRYKRESCIAFDWEAGTIDGFPFLDAAHWLTSVSNLIHHRDPRTAREEVAARVAEYLPRSRREYASAIAGLSAAHELATWYPPAQLDDAAEAWLRAFVEAGQLKLIAP